MGCPSNVRLYTSYYNNFIMASLMNSLSVSHILTVVVHTVSIIYASTLSEKVSDSQKYTMTEIKKHVTPAVINATDNTTISPEVITYPAKAVTEGPFYMINPMNQIIVLNAVVLAAMLMHIARTVSSDVRDALNYNGEKWFPGIFMQVLHIASYGISHFIAIFLIFLISGYRDVLSALLIFVAVISLEALQHFSANPNKPELGLDGMSKTLIGLFAGAPTLLSTIMIGVALGNRDRLPHAVLAFVALIVLEALKFITEVLGSFNLSTYGLRQFDMPRISHALYDVLIKVFLVWYLVLQALEETGGIDGETDLSTQYIIVGWVGCGAVILYMLYGPIAAMLGLPPIPAARLAKEDFPSATMEEKSRMLQVA